MDKPQPEFVLVLSRERMQQLLESSAPLIASLSSWWEGEGGVASGAGWLALESPARAQAFIAEHERCRHPRARYDAASNDLVCPDCLEHV